MLTFGDLNLIDINSVFINSLIENDSDEDALSKIELCDLFQNQELIEAFNKRYITPQNINEIISLCDYLMLENTESFLKKNAEMIYKIIDYNLIVDFYKLNEQHSKNYQELFPPHVADHKFLNYETYFSFGFLKYLKTLFEEIILIDYPEEHVLLPIKEDIANYKSRLCNFNAEYGHLDCLKYLIDIGAICDDDIYIEAIYGGQLNCVKYLFEKGFPFHENCITCAAENGHLECLIFCHKNGCPLNNNAIFHAAESNHLDCLTYLIENGCPVELFASYYCVKEGNFECLKYLHKNGCPWDEGTCKEAARNGYLDCLKYLHENGCPWDQRTTKFAYNNNEFDCFQYAIENGCDFDTNIDICYIVDLKEDFKTYLFSILKSKLTKNQFKKLKTKIAEKNKKPTPFSIPITFSIPNLNPGFFLSSNMLVNITYRPDNLE